MDRDSCVHRHRVGSTGFHPGGTCLRVETMSPADRCALKLKSHSRARGITVEDMGPVCCRECGLEYNLV